MGTDGGGARVIRWSAEGLGRPTPRAHRSIDETQFERRLFHLFCGIRRRKNFESGWNRTPRTCVLLNCRHPVGDREKQR